MVGKYQSTLAGDERLRVVNFGLSLPPSSGQFWIITPNLFHDPVIVTAFLDRLLHHSVVINMRGNSYRLRGKVGKEGVEMSQS